eukprot:5499797-Amphidinium_carterae.1
MAIEAPTAHGTAWVARLRLTYSSRSAHKSAIHARHHGQTHWTSTSIISLRASIAQSQTTPSR